MPVSGKWADLPEKRFFFATQFIAARSFHD
jgi:hypothetical protein